MHVSDQNFTSLTLNIIEFELELIKRHQETNFHQNNSKNLVISLKKA
jgi:hypothetical protein